MKKRKKEKRIFEPFWNEDSFEWSKMNFKKKKSKKDSFVIRARDYKGGRLYGNLWDELDPIKLLNHETPKSLIGDSRIIRNKFGIYLCKLKYVEPVSDNQAPEEQHIVSLDQGIYFLIS